MAADGAGDSPPPVEWADQDDLVQIKLLDKLDEVVGVGVQVIAVPGLAGAAMAAAVVAMAR